MYFIKTGHTSNTDSVTLTSCGVLLNPLVAGVAHEGSHCCAIAQVRILNPKPFL